MTRPRARMLCGGAFVLGMFVFGFSLPRMVPGVVVVFLSAWGTSVVLVHSEAVGRALGERGEKQ